jgi:uncharacterized protein YbbK (DUF523 family)
MGRSRGAVALARRLADRRGGRVVLLSHCLLDVNTRYLGGAGRAGCVREVVDACADAGLGMVQLPCPEQRAWGGVLKRRLLLVYGSGRWLPGPLRRALLRAGLAWTRVVYRRLARQTARQVADYRRSGLHVVAVVGVDGSPSCGVTRALDVRAAADRLAACPRGTMSVHDATAVVRDTVVPGRGLFTAALQERLRRRRIDVPFVAHDLVGELDGRPSPAVPALERLARA